MKKITLTLTQRDVLLFKALHRNVFPQPKKGEMFFSLSNFSQGLDATEFIYLENDYYKVLHDAILNAERDGKFDSSNAKNHWLGLVYSFQDAMDVKDVDHSNLKEWES